GFTFMPISCFVFFRRFREDPAWRTFAGGKVAAGLAFVVSIALLKIQQLQRSAGQNVIGGLIGLTQRVGLITYLAWIIAFAVRLRNGGIEPQDQVAVRSLHSAGSVSIID